MIDRGSETNEWFGSSNSVRSHLNLTSASPVGTKEQKPEGTGGRRTYASPVANRNREKLRSLRVVPFAVEFCLLVLFSACLACPFLLIPMSVASNHDERLAQIADLVKLKESGVKTKANAETIRKGSYFNKIDKRRHETRLVKYEFEAEGRYVSGTHKFDSIPQFRIRPYAANQRSSTDYTITVTYLPGNPDVHRVGAADWIRIPTVSRWFHIALTSLACLPSIAVFGIILRLGLASVWKRNMEYHHRSNFSEKGD